MQGLFTPKGAPTAFFPEKQEAETKWIDADRIYRLWEIAYCWGGFLPLFEPPVVAYTDKYVGIYLSSSAMTIQLLGKEPEFHEFKLVNGLDVQWDKSLTLLMVENWIFETYQLARSKNLIEGQQLVLLEREISFDMPLAV